MDRTEQAIFEYLTHQGLPNVIYEPDGQIPPDFSIDSRIGVEVTRLDQNVGGASGRRSLEQDAAPLGKIILTALASMGPPDGRGCWFVTYRFRRPLPPWKELRRRVPDFLREISRSDIQHIGEYPLTEALSFTFYRTETIHPTRFVFGGYGDGNAGGFVVAEIVRNLRLCMDEKARKIEPFRERYAEWWLAVVDLIGYGNLDDWDLSTLRPVMPVTAPWQRILLVNPKDHTQAVEL